VIAFIAVASGCAGNPVAPFDGFKTVPVTAYRLQNFEPTPQAAATPAAPNLLPGLPAEIQKWVQAGASALPPGLLPPGLIPGLATQAAPVVDTTPRFHGFRVIGAPANVVDDKLRQELINIFGYEKEFGSAHSNCNYSEFGFSFARASQPPADVLVSFSCNQVQAQNFIWPHKYTGLTQDSSNRIVKVAQALFGG
jgi:hypothetical protein